MLAAVLEDVEKLVVKDIEPPKISENEVLIEVKAASICNTTDWHIIEGKHRPQGGRFPSVLGHEGSGVVAEVGRCVKGINVGDKVAMRGWHPGCFAEYTKIRPDRMILIPENMEFEDASCLEMLAPVANLTRKCVELGDLVIILGLGPAGLMMVQTVKAAGADTIIASEPLETRRKLGEEFGADHLIDPAKEDVIKRVREITRFGADVVIDTAGVPETYKILTDLVKPGGVIGLFGLAWTPISLSGFHEKGARLIPSGEFCKTCGGELVVGPDGEVYRTPSYYYTRFVMQRALRLVETGKVNLKRLITHRFLLKEIHKAFSQIKEKPNETLKVIIKPRP